MRELFFSLVSRNLFMVLLDDGKVVRKIYEDNYRRHSENFLSKVEELFSGLAFSINSLSKLFFLTGPGGQTGERVSLSFVLASLLASPTIEVFSMDSLTFQAAASKECLSVISMGNQSKSYYLTVYQCGEVSLKREGIKEEEFVEVKKMFPNLSVKIDLEELDFLYNFLICKKEFRTLTNKLV